MDETELDKLLTDWVKAEANATHWAQEELTLRKKIFEGNFKNPVAGMNKLKIGHGMALIGDYRLNYTIDKAVLEESRGFIPAALLDEIISYRPEVKGGAFRKLSADDKKHFAAIITEKPGTPGLELKPQNKVRW